MGSNTYLYLKFYLNTEFFVFVIELKITKGYVFVFDIWSIFEKYLQIQSNTHNKYQQKVNIARHKLAQESTECFSYLDNNGQAALRKLAYSEAV